MLSKFAIRTGLSVSAMAMAILLQASAPGQSRVKVSIDTGKILNPLTARSLGVGLDGFDGSAIDPQTMLYLHVAGIHTLRYPGNGGTSGIYHWASSTVINPYKDGKAPFFAPTNNFTALAASFAPADSMIVSVNYGSNPDGSGGGEPAEAAAWVAYANGNPESTQALGKDSTGNDWKTVGYWAGLRAASPVSPDDGLNALRISHPQPLGIQLWQIGNEAWNNGFYGPGHADEFDLHSGLLTTNKKDWHHQGNAHVGPTAYAEGVAAFARAMKAVDPKIQIGASLTTPAINVNWIHSMATSQNAAWELSSDAANAVNWGGDWDNEVLKVACGQIDFGALSLLESPTLAPDFKVVDEDQLLQSVSKDYQALVVDLLARFQKYCPAGHTPRLAFTDFGVPSFANIKHPSVLTLFTADAVSTLIETGAVSIDWPSYHNAMFLEQNSQGNRPQPAYLGYQMVHVLAYQPGDAFVRSQSTSDLLAVHATKRRDGGYGLLLINKDPKQAVQVTVRYAGDTPGKKGNRFDFNEDAFKAGKGLIHTQPDNLGGNFTIEIPAYTATAILIPKAQ